MAGVVDYYGPSDIGKTSVIKNDVVPSWATTAFLGEDEYDENARKASAVNYVDEKTAPFLILHGTKDGTVPIEQSNKLYEKLQKQGIYAEYYQILGAGHGEDIFYQKKIKELVLAFLDKLVRGSI